MWFNLAWTGGFGAIVGPLLIAASMDHFGNQAFFWSMGLAHTITGLFALFRMTRRKAKPLPEQGNVTPAAMHATSSAFEYIQQHAVEESESDTDSTDSNQGGRRPPVRE